ncbi:GAP family protein [Francisella sp. 19X1-34]|uniref:GAP family protein n=1 Tax=Francisella sp. 19X1-34 TaxID=3087177 RepID=UPI002E3483E0|nr:GAP family protein [Francisella sp. 19X1-34]MED7787783.1 GAP family protein [Francisella sp. 19X1-34]
MDSLLESIILSFSGFLSVGSIVLVLLLLISNQNIKQAAAFVSGYIFGYSFIGIMYVYAGSKLVKGGELIPPAFVFVVGLLLIYVGLKNLLKKRQAKPKEAKIFTLIRKLTAKRAFLFGLLITVINIKNLAIFISIVSVISASEVEFFTKIFVVFIDTFIFCLAMIILICIRAILRDLATSILIKIKAWIDKNSRHIMTFLPTVFGLYFIFKVV